VIDNPGGNYGEAATQIEGVLFARKKLNTKSADTLGNVISKGARANANPDFILTKQ
jgi:hypothetical protein